MRSLVGIDLLLPDYITMLALSCLIGMYLCVKAAERQGIPVNISLNALLFAFIFSIVGARFYYLIQHYKFYISHPAEMFALWKGGLASYGGYVGGTVAVILYLRSARISVWKFADCCAPSIALGIFLTRIGCFMNGCCYGKTSQLPWAVRFPRGSAPYVGQLLNGQISGYETLSLPVHPTQLYHSVAGLITFLMMIYLHKRRTSDGQLFLAFAFLYSLGRFGIEFFRGDISRGFVGIFSLPQLFSIVAAVVVGYLLILKLEFHKKAKI